MAKDLDYFKKKIMAILNKQNDEGAEATPEINKSLNDIDFIYNTLHPDTFGEIEKSRGYGIGTIREWKGRKYKKIAPNKWRLVYESNSRGAKQSIAYLKKAVMAAKSTDELLQIVMENVNRFTGPDGKTLDIVAELQEAVKSAKTALNGKKPAAETPKTEPKKEEKPKEFNEKEVLSNLDNYVKTIGAVYGIKNFTDEDNTDRTFNRVKDHLESDSTSSVDDADGWNKKAKQIVDYAKIKGLSIDGLIKQSIKNNIKKDSGEEKKPEPETKNEEIEGYKIGDTVKHNGEKAWKIDKFFNEAGRKMVGLRSISYENVYHEIPVEKMKEEQTETPKKEEKPAEPAKEEPKKDNNEEAKAEMNKWKGVFDKYYNDHNTGVGHWLDWVERPGQEVRSKAWGKAQAIKNLIAMREGLKNDYGIDTPEIPQEIIDKYNDYSEQVKQYPGYGIPSEVNKILSSYKNAKLRDAFNAIMQPVKDKYFESKNKIQLETIPDKVEPVANLSNKEHAELFEMRKNPNNDEEEILFYNGKPYGNDGEKGYGYSNPLADQIEMVEAVGMDPVKQAEWVFNKFESNPDEVGYQWSFDSAIKKYGEEKLRKLAEPSMSNEEFMDKLREEVQKKTHTYKWIAGQVRGQLYNKRVEETAKKYLDKLTASTSAINDVDIPVDPADMDEAISIIGSDVDRILSGRDFYGNTKQGLPDKIKRRVRNNPGVARAMFVYIKQKQDETGKTVFTPKHSIWEEFSKLNENAMQSALNGESETKGGSSGNLYKGDDISSVVEDKDAGRYQITFTGKPDYETRTVLKQHGFRWAPSLGVWQCFNTQHGENSLRRVAEKLGWEKDGE